MTLAQRLLLAICVLTIAAMATLGLGVREAWRSTEEERFQQQFEGAVKGLQRQLQREVRSLSSTIEPQCRYSPVVDSAALSLGAGNLDAGERNRLSGQGPNLAKALQVDELYLFTDEGSVLTGHRRALAGTKETRLAELLRTKPTAARVRPDRKLDLAIEALCVKRSGGRAVGLYAARRLDPLLESMSDALAVKLSVGQTEAGADEMVRRVKVQELGGLELTVARSRVPLATSLRRLDLTILGIGGSTLLVALIVSLLLSRGLARPLAKLADEAGQVLDGEPKPVTVRGSKELRNFADAFNKTIADLAALRKRLAATERIAARREIARRVAHEIKNPLAPIRAAVETLRRLRARNDPAFDEYFDEATATVLDEVRRINTIVGEFTRFARLPAPSPAPIDVVETVRKVVNLHAAKGNVQLDSEPLPEVNADADQLVQVTTNLVQNALDAVKDQPEGAVRVELRAIDAERVRMTVLDNGPGVPTEIRERLFEPYATTKPHGTGLGLAIVQRIVIEHGGEIEYVDGPQGGACFRVTLPTSGPTLLAEPPTLTPVHEAAARPTPK